MYRSASSASESYRSYNTADKNSLYHPFTRIFAQRVCVLGRPRCNINMTAQHIDPHSMWHQEPVCMHKSSRAAITAWHVVDTQMEACQPGSTSINAQAVTVTCGITSQSQAGNMQHTFSSPCSLLSCFPNQPTWYSNSSRWHLARSSLR